MSTEEILSFLTPGLASEMLAKDIADCIEQMHEEVAHFFFLKADGSTREAWGTTATAYVEKHWTPVPGKPEKKKAPGVSSFFDIEKNEWRSFNWSRFKSFDRDYCS